MTEPTKKRPRKRAAKKNNLEDAIRATQTVLAAGLTAYRVIKPLVQKHLSKKKPQKPT